MSTQRRFDVSSLSHVERTPQGGLRVKASITRVGVFSYAGTDGRTVHEYRPPEEVFSPASLQTLPDAPVTLGHPGLITADNYGDHSQGHVREAKRDGDRVDAHVVIQGGRAIKAIERGTRQISCGYTCNIDETPGTSPAGERYDRVQRDIRYNHVALVDKGRAGDDIRLRLDAAGDQIERTQDMTYRTDDPNSPQPDWQAIAELAQKVAGQAFDCTGMSIAQIKQEAVKRARPELDLAGASTQYVAGLFDALAGRKDSADARLDVADEARARMIERNRGAWRGDAATLRQDEQHRAESDHRREMMRLHAELRRRECVAAQALRHDTAGLDYERLKADMEQYVAEANRLITEQMRSYNENAWRNPSAPGNNDRAWKEQQPGGALAGGMQPNALHKPGDQGGR